MSTRKKKSEKPGGKQLLWKILRYVLFVVGAGIAAVLLFILLVWAGLFGKIPTRDALKNIDNYASTEVYSADSVLLGRYFIQERTITDYKQISPHIINALVATEDVRFFEHDGVDYRSLFRVLFKTLLLQDNSAGGGSTISQQLGKNLFPRGNTSKLDMPVIKVKEAIIAKRLESVYTKEEILTHYLNTVPFGGNVFGIEMASRRFFDKHASQVNLQEAAVLVGMLKANSTYNPHRNPDLSKGRRNIVLGQMKKYGYLKERSLDSLSALPLELHYTRITHTSGLATYFREFLRPQLQDWCETHAKEDGSPYNLYTDGLKVYTTIDSHMQRYAEEAMQVHMKDLQEVFDDHWGKAPWKNDASILTAAIKRSEHYRKLAASGKSYEEAIAEMNKKVPMKVFSWEGSKETQMSPIDSVKHYLRILQTGILAMDPNKGDILAWVGGIDFEYFQYDHVNITTKRQVGSTFKPFVFAAALEAGMDPCDYVSGSRVEYTNLANWSPGNADPDEYEHKYSFSGALSRSVNTVTVKVLEEVGVDKTIELVHKMGIESDLPKVPSIALGTADISLMEMVTAYCTFANGGRKIEPRYLTSVEDIHGKLLEKFEYNKEKPRVMSKETSEIMIQLLRDVVDEGTASRLRTTYGLKNDLAGKTGTTQSNADGWFIGFNRRLVIGIWTGADDPAIRFRSTSLGQGANMAAPVFARIFQQINEDPTFRQTSLMKFPPPSRRILRMLNCEPVRDDKGFLEDLFGSDDKDKPEKTTRGYGEKKDENIFDKIGDIFKKKKRN